MGSLFWLGKAKGSPGIGIIERPLVWAFLMLYKDNFNNFNTYYCPHLAQFETRSAIKAPVATLHFTRNSKALSGRYLPTGKWRRALCKWYSLSIADENKPIFIFHLLCEWLHFPGNLSKQVSKHIKSNALNFLLPWYFPSPHSGRSDLLLASISNVKLLKSYSRYVEGLLKSPTLPENLRILSWRKLSSNPSSRQLPRSNSSRSGRNSSRPTCVREVD